MLFLDNRENRVQKHIGEAIKTAWSGEDRFCWQTPTRSSARCCGTQWKRQAYSRSSLPAMGMRFWKGYTRTSRSCSFWTRRCGRGRHPRPAPAAARGLRKRDISHLRLRVRSHAGGRRRSCGSIIFCPSPLPLRRCLTECAGGAERAQRSAPAFPACDLHPA